MRILSRSLTTACFLSIGFVARAEAEKPYAPCTQQASDPDANGAKAAFQAGTVSFNEADYPRAILYWEDAYRRDCTADIILFNLARAYELNGQKRQALLALETFLEREPNSNEKPQIVRRIEVLKKQIEAEPAPAPSATAAATASATAPQPAAPPAEQPPPASKTGGKPVFPLIIAGVGGVMFILGSLTYLDATSKVNEYESHCDDRENRSGCPDDEVPKAEEQRKRQRTGAVVSLVSLPIIAGGVIWYAVAPRSTASTRVTPNVGKNFVGLSLDGSF
jgi:tetratricopeptide (TPR) repeat protein